MITRHDTTPSDNVSQNSAQRSPAPSPALSPQLRDALRQWDDTDADTLAASKERLVALGPQVSDTLASFIRRRARMSVVGTNMFFINFPLMGVVMFVWSLHHSSHDPMPVVMSATLFTLMCVSMIGIIVGSALIGNSQSRNAAKALAEINPLMALNISLEFGLGLSTCVEGKSFSTITVTTALQRLLADETPSCFPFQTNSGSVCGVLLTLAPTILQSP